MLDRGLLKLLKTLRQLQEAHPWTFLHCGALLPCLELVVGQLLAPWPQRACAAATDRAYMMQCLLLVHGVCKSPSYRGSAATLTLNLDAKVGVLLGMDRCTWAQWACQSRSSSTPIDLDSDTHPLTHP